jgi:hypothetical protein
MILICLVAIVSIAERFVGLQVYSQQLGLLKRPYKVHLELSAHSEPPRVGHLWSCLDSCKKFFEYLLSIPEGIYATFTTVQWASMVQGVLVLSRLTFVMASTLGWDADTTRSNIPFAMYLESLCYRFQHLSATPGSWEVGGVGMAKEPDYLFIMKTMLENVKTSYERRVAAIEPGFLSPERGHTGGISSSGAAAAAAAVGGKCPVFDPTLQAIFSTPDFAAYEESVNMGTTPSSSNTSSSSAPLYHDLWATMTGSWAEQF